LFLNSRTCFFLLFSIVFHILWIYDDAYDHFRKILFNICNLAPGNSKLLV
jgi:hypothetical protein